MILELFFFFSSSPAPSCALQPPIFDVNANGKVLTVILASIHLLRTVSPLFVSAVLFSVPVHLKFTLPFSRLCYAFIFFFCILLRVHRLKVSLWLLCIALDFQQWRTLRRNTDSQKPRSGSATFAFYPYPQTHHVAGKKKYAHVV